METSGTSPKVYKVFISYAQADRQIARKITEAMLRRGVPLLYDAYETTPGSPFSEALTQAISSSDYVIVLLSPDSVGPQFVGFELDYATHLSRRGLTILPVLIRDCAIPAALSNYQVFDLRGDFERGLSDLLDKVALVPDLDFSKLTARQFDNLVSELLVARGFKVETCSRGSDGGIDFKATYRHTDPFGMEKSETWLVGTKFYREQRPSVRLLQEFAGRLSGVSPGVVGLVVTNAQLTAPAREWLGSAQDSKRIDVRVLEGPELRRILLSHPTLVKKFFSSNEAANE